MHSLARSPRGLGEAMHAIALKFSSHLIEIDAVGRQPRYQHLRFGHALIDANPRLTALAVRDHHLERHSIDRQWRDLRIHGKRQAKSC